MPPPQGEEAFIYDEDDDDDIRSGSGRMGLADVPAWMLTQRPRAKRALRDIEEDEEEMEMEAPADEVRDAVEALPTKLPRSEKARDQVQGVLIERLLSKCEDDPIMHMLVE